jgi:hypothetical protein
MTLRDRCVCGLAGGACSGAIVYAITANARATAAAIAVCIFLNVTVLYR